MRSSDFLFRLIKALSKGDRRNLKLYGRLQEGDKKYLQLFDAIDEQEEYDEPALLEQFKDERFIIQFSVAKNYLYNYILKTLHIFHKDQHSEIGMLQHQAEILMSKNLHDQAHKIVRKAKHMASKQERFQELLTLLDHERKILHVMQRTKEYAAFIQDIANEEDKVLSQISNLMQYQHHVDFLFVAVRNGKKDAEVKRKVQELLVSPMFISDVEAESVRAKLKRLGIMVDAHLFLNDISKAYACTVEAIQIYESEPEITRELNARYLLTLANQGVLAYQSGKPQLAIAILNKFRYSKTYNDEEELRVFEKYYYFKIALCIELGNVDEGIAAIKDFDESLGRIEGLLTKSEELGIYYVSAYFFISIGRPESALPWLNKLLNEPRTELRMDLQCMARIAALLIHYELGNHDLIEYMVKSATRFIANRGQMLNVEKISLKYFRRLASLGPESSLEAVLKEFRNELEAVSADRLEQNSLELLDVKVWTEAKLAKRTMSDIFRGQVPQEIGLS